MVSQCRRVTHIYVNKSLCDRFHKCTHTHTHTQVLTAECKSGFEAMALALRYPNARILVNQAILQPSTTTTTDTTSDDEDFSLDASEIEVRFPNLLKLQEARSRKLVSDVGFEADFEAAAASFRSAREQQDREPVGV